jgi:probable F420-dependent oxidoreductase
MTTADARQLKVGIILPVAEGRMGGATPRWSDLLTMATRAEELGFDSVWVVDHLLVESPGEGTIGCWECWSLLAALAAATSRVELGTLVACASFRNPTLLAKMADTVEEISGGRLILGLGAGHHAPEYRAFGYPFDHRVSRFAEALQIIYGLLRQGAIDFAGRYHQARECELRPRGPRANGPPILLGTTGERMLDLTARYADAWNVYFDKTGNQPGSIAPLRERLDTACAEIGRDAATLERTASIIVGMDGRTRMPGVGVPLFTGTTEQIAEELRAYAEQGITHVQVRVEPNTAASVEAFAPVLDVLSAEC